MTAASDVPQDVMTRVAEVLRKHVWNSRSSRCRCGWAAPGQSYPTHVASVLAGAGVLTTPDETSTDQQDRIHRALALHVPDRSDTCDECFSLWPCPTVRALSTGGV